MRIVYIIFLYYFYFILIFFFIAGVGARPPSPSLPLHKFLGPLRAARKFSAPVKTISYKMTSWFSICTAASIYGKGAARTRRRSAWAWSSPWSTRATHRTSAPRTHRCITWRADASRACSCLRFMDGIGTSSFSLLFSSLLFSSLFSFLSLLSSSLHPQSWIVTTSWIACCQYSHSLLPSLFSSFFNLTISFSTSTILDINDATNIPLVEDTLRQYSRSCTLEELLTKPKELDQTNLGTFFKILFIL